MNVSAVLYVAGLLSGFLLMTRVPLCRSVARPGNLGSKPDSGETAKPPSVAIIIPARNEEQNLPRLLSSISPYPVHVEVVVVDDNSTDATSLIAHKCGARVVIPGVPPKTFTGKTWACVQGAESTTAEMLCFLDADVFLLSNGLQNIFAAATPLSPATALSVLPYVITEHPYEELSLFFNMLMTFGSGGFGLLGSPRLFGQSLLISRPLYRIVGGHAAVSSFVLENFHLSRLLAGANAKSVCLGGRGTLCMRMFPESLTQLRDGWTKAFADGAKSTDPAILFVSILWLSALASISLNLFLAPSPLRPLAVLLYIVAVVQIYFFARQIGSFRLVTSLLFPVPLLFFFVIFARSAARKAMHRPTSWRGRQV